MPDHGFGKLYDDKVDPLAVQPVRCAVFAYDFTVDGGAVGTITLRGEAVPADAIVLYGLFVPGRVNLVTTNNDGTISLGVEALADLMATSAAINANLDETITLIPIFGAAATTVAWPVTTVARSVRMVVATDAITAGDFKVYLVFIAPGNVPAT
jgi:hypothetical protein